MSGLVQAVLLLSAAGIPLILAVLLRLPSSRRWGMALAPFAAAPALALVGLGSVEPPVRVPWLMLGAYVGLDRIGLVFLFLTSLIWLLAGLYARRSLAGEEGAARFFTFFLLAMAGNLGLVVARDMVLFYVFFALMSFATYGLVVHRGRPEERRAGRIYLVFVVIGEMALFTALLLGQQAAGSIQFAQVRAAVPGHAVQDAFMAMAVIGFGIKSGLLTLHVWMPLAYRAAPVPAAAALAGAMFTAGLLGWLRLLPIGEAALPLWGNLLIAAGLLAVFYGVFVGLTQKDPKTVLAYSSMSQMGLMTAGVGAALAVPESWPILLGAVVVFALHHAFAKAALFLGVGVARAADARQAWLVGAGLLLPSLALAGVPGTSGAIAKAMLKTGAIAAEPPGAWLYAALPWSSLATTLLLGRFLWLAWPRPSDQQIGAAPGLWLPWLLLLLAVAGALWWLPWAKPEGLWTSAAVLTGLGPVVVGVLIAAVAAWLSDRGLIRIRLSVPPGDLLVPLSYASEAVFQGARWFGNQWLPARRRRVRSLVKIGVDKLVHTTGPARLETRMTRWRVGIGFYLLLAVALATMMISLR